VAISAVCLGLLFYFTDFEQLMQSVRLADYRLVLVAALITLVWLIVRSVVWRTLLEEKASFSQVFYTLNEGYLLNNFLPFRLGEVGRAFLLGRKAGMGFWRVLSSILIERALDMALAAGLLLSTLPFVVGANWVRQAGMAAGGLVGLGFFILYLTARHRSQAEELFGKITLHWHWLARLGQKSVPAFLDGLVVLTDPKRFLKAVVWMVLNWLVAIGQYFAFLRAFTPQAGLLWACFSLGVSALGIAVPSSPGALGVLELSLVGALALFGLNPAVSLAFALTMHLSQYLLTGVVGVYALVRDGESLTSLYVQARRIRAGKD
jgi:uncharacterized protein (TIRG00374 family)